MFFLRKRGKKKFEADYAMAKAEFEQKNYDKAEQLMLKWSQKGFAEATVLLREIAIRRKASALNTEMKRQYHDEAMRLMKMAADQGDATCQFRYGMALEFPETFGLETDIEQAVHYYSLAARQGDNRALNNLGCLYQFGKGVERDFEKARELYKKAIAAGNPRGYMALGYMYQWGKGGEIDFYAAKEYFYKGRAKAGEELYRARETSNHEMIGVHQSTIEEFDRAIEKLEIEMSCVESRSESAEGKKKAEEKILSYAMAGNGRAQFEMGLLCYNRNEYAAALDWYKKSGEKGFSGAVANIGNIYFFGKGVKTDYKLAFEYFTKSEKMNGNKWAMYMLGRMYRNGYYVEKDDKKAVEWFQKAADQMEYNAIGSLGIMYEEGRGVPRDYKKAAQLYTKALEGNLIFVAIRLGDLYAKGLGVEKDLNKAIELMTKSQAAGHEYAKKRLPELYRERYPQE